MSQNAEQKAIKSTTTQVAVSSRTKISGVKLQMCQKSSRLVSKEFLMKIFQFSVCVLLDIYSRVCNFCIVALICKAIWKSNCATKVLQQHKHHVL